MVEIGGRGGVADYTQDLTRELARDGVEVVLATATDHLYPLVAGVTALPVFAFLRPTTRLRRALRRGKAHKAFHAVAQFAAYLRLLPVARRCGVVHVQGFYLPPLSAVAFALLRATGAALVHTPHNTFDRGMSFARTRAIMHRLCTRIVVHTRADLVGIPVADRARTVVIPHASYGWLAAGAAPPDRAQARDELGIAGDAPVVLCFGHMRDDKGLEDVVAALREIPELHAIFAGEDHGAAAMVRGALRDPQIAGRVHLREGWQSMDDAARWFAAADAAVFAYRRASQSGALLLSYGFHTPVVAYPVGGLPEAIVDGETGWLAPAADVPALVKMLRAVVAAGPQECARRGAAGAAFAEREFSGASVARRTAALYRDARQATRRARGARR
jgi:glycosyltransferase involved in cell wall biosynthesis